MNKVKVLYNLKYKNLTILSKDNQVQAYYKKEKFVCGLPVNEAVQKVEKLQKNGTSENIIFTNKKSSLEIEASEDLITVLYNGICENIIYKG